MKIKRKPLKNKKKDEEEKKVDVHSENLEGHVGKENEMDKKYFKKTSMTDQIESKKIKKEEEKPL